MKNIFIITQKEPFYIPKMVKQLILNQNKGYKIVGYTILDPSKRNKSNVQWYKERINIYNIKEMIMVGLVFFYVKIISTFLRSKTPYSSEKLFKKHRIPHFKTNDINSSEYIEVLKEIEISHIISISCPQILKNDIINVSKESCLNLHGTLLPRHRGVFGSWWTLYEDDYIGGSTIHKIVLKLDSGDIVWQKTFKIESDDTQYSIAYKTKRDMTLGLIELLSTGKKIEKLLKTIEVEPSYHRAPNSSQGKQFHKKGKKIIKFRDIKFIISKQFI